MLLLPEEKAAKPEKDDRYNDVLYHPSREIVNATLRGFGRPSIHIALSYKVLLPLAAGSLLGRIVPIPSDSGRATKSQCSAARNFLSLT